MKAFYVKPTIGENEMKPEVKQMPLMPRIVLTLIAGSLMMWAAVSCSKPDTPEVAAAKRAEWVKLSRMSALTDMIKQTAHDPDSIQIDRIYISESNVAVTCAAYRGKNGFGGVVRGVATLKGNEFTTSATRFQTWC